MKIGIVGGTFDPFHRGHLETVLAVRERLAWDRVDYVPAWMQPFKQQGEAVSSYHRHAMVVLGTQDHDGLVVSPRELERGAVSYTVDTLEEYRHEFPEATIEWVVGEDNLAALLQWKSLGRIFEIANFVVLRRPENADGGRRAEVPAEIAERVTSVDDRPAHGAIVFAENPVVPISATAIRGRIRGGGPVDELVGPAVARYIERHDLYRKATS